MTRLVVFDSGVGGLSVAIAIRAQLPAAEIVYVADDAGGPYGEWEDGALTERVVGLIGGLVAEHRPDAVVIACHTASTLVLPPLRERFAIPFVGTVPAIITAFIISFFPILVNVATGIATVEPELKDVLRALGASNRQIIMKVGLPRSMPYFFASLKVAITVAFVGSIMSETVAANGEGQRTGVGRRSKSGACADASVEATVEPGIEVP